MSSQCLSKKILVFEKMAPESSFYRKNDFRQNVPFHQFVDKTSTRVESCKFLKSIEKFSENYVKTHKINNELQRAKSKS